MEQTVVDRALREYGVRSIKLNISGNNDWPDRLFFIAGGRPLLIEFKAHGEDPNSGQTLVHQFLQHHDKQIGQALTKYSLPKNHRNVARMAEVLAQYEEANMPIDASMAVQIVKGELQTDVKETFVDLLKTNPQLVFEMLGPDGIKAITDQRVATVTGGGPKAPQNPMPPKIETPKEPETFEEVRARLKLTF